MSSSPVTLITGTRKGIGKYLAQHYVTAGHVVVGCSRSVPDWNLNGYEHFQLDVGDEKAVRSLFTSLAKKHGRLDNCINNAGIAAMNHSLLTPLTTAQKVLSTNVLGTFLFCREAAKLMQKNKHGRIVNFSTVAVPLKLEGEAIYAASKAAIVSLTQIMAKEFGSWGITVNAIGPTPVDTDLVRHVPKEKMEKLLESQAIKRYGTFGDITNIIDFYLKDESGFVTGQVLYLGGV